MPEQKYEESSTYHWTIPVPPGEPVKKYAWSFDKGRMNCCASTTSSCNVSKLWQAAEPVTFHDADLVKATKEINAILDAARGINRDPSRELHFIQIEDRHMLAWVHSDLIGSNNDDATIGKMLRLKPDRDSGKPARPRKTRGKVA